MLGALTRRFGRFDVAEDATQEALLAAGLRWPAGGIPDDPRSWLIRVGYRKMVDLLRAESAGHRREQLVGAEQLAMAAPDRQATVWAADDSLTVVLLCCHPALSPTSQVALTLRAVGGLSTAEIAHAYGVSEATMATRVSRAKQQLRRAGARFTAPTGADLAARLVAVQAVLYLIFNEGYTASSGDHLGRLDLAEEAIRLARLLHRALPDQAEATGLLALMLLTEARRNARTGPLGELVPLEEQDRSRWNADRIFEGTALLDGVWTRGEIGPYQLQAAIAALHAAATRPEDTDWPQIVGLYLWLERLLPANPVRLGLVVAVAKAEGPGRGLALLDDFERVHHLAGDPLVRQRERAVRAHLLDESGDAPRAAAHYREAAALTDNRAEREYLLARAERSGHTTSGGAN